MVYFRNVAPLISSIHTNRAVSALRVHGARVQEPALAIYRQKVQKSTNSLMSGMALQGTSEIYVTTKGVIAVLRFYRCHDHNIQRFLFCLQNRKGFRDKL